MFDRRGVVGGLAALAVPGAAAGLTAADMRVDIPATASGPTVPDELVSLSYEVLALTNPDFFSAGNSQLVRLFKGLNARGVLRLGGNTAEFAKPAGFTGVLPPLELRKRPFPYYDVTDRALRELAGFLDATGWRAIYGISLKAGSAALVAATADRVNKLLGDRVIAIQIGNEPTQFVSEYGAYRSALNTMAATIEPRLLAGPDIFMSPDWVTGFARDFPQAALISQHYYRGAAEEGSLAQILQHDDKYEKEMRDLAVAAHGHRHGFWLTEINSYYNGGLEGVSDTFASTLWGLDFALSAARSGVSGLCFHGGARKAIEASLAGLNTRSKNTARNAILDATSCYSPIAGDLTAGFATTPLYVGLQCAREMAGVRLHAIDAAAGPNLRVFSGKMGGVVRIVAVNTDMASPRSIGFTGLAAQAPVKRAPLTATGVTSVEPPTFGAGTDSSGRLRWLADGARVDGNGRFRLTVPAASAAPVQVGR